MADDRNSKLSGEDIRKFAETLSKFDASLVRQEEIAKKVLAIEKDIANVRFGALKPYFDAYSKGLDEVIARKTSKLNDAFLIAERKAFESFKQAASETASSNNSKVASQAKASTQNNRNDDKTNNSQEKVVEVVQILDDSQRSELGEEARTAEKIVERLNAFAEKYKTIEEQTNAIVTRQVDAVISIEQLKTARQTARKKADDQYAKDEQTFESTLTDLTMARLQEREDRESRLRAEEIKHQIATAKTQLDTQNYLNDVIAKRTFEATPEAVRLEAEKNKELENQKSIAELEERRIKDIAKKERQLKRELNRELTAEEKARVVARANEAYKLDQKNLDKITKERKEREEKERRKEQGKANRKAIDEAVTAPLSKENPLTDRIKTLYNVGRDEDGNRGFGTSMLVAITALSSLIKQLELKVDEIASYKSFFDTRLQGSSNITYFGSYWDQIIKDMTGIGAINPYFKQQDFANNIKALVDVGIAFDLEQRAFLATISDKIANTFEVTDGTLLRLVRIQQEDSTAGRLGMEAVLNSFLNNMYENTEYLKKVADGVRASLEEMESLMSGAEATEVEYQVQKWLGSLYSVGMSQDAVNRISTALGQIGAGQIEGLTSGGAGNLLIMAANDAGISIADILTNGLDASQTNELLQASVNYLAELAESSKDNQVVQQQLANVFGVKASDLRAASNITLPGSTAQVYKNSLTYDNMIAKLIAMADSMGSRTSVGEQMANIWANGQYTLAGSLASSPISYLIYKSASLLEETTGGISLPFINVSGFGVDLNTTVADLMRVGALAGSLFSNIGPIISGLGNSFSGRSMLNELGIKSESRLEITPRGTGDNLLGSRGGGDRTTSGSGYVGNGSGSDIKNSTMQEAEDSKKQLMIEAKEEAETNQVDVLNTTVLKIYELLDDVAHGNSSFKVQVEGYGLTKAGNANGRSGAQGGVSALGSAGSDDSFSSGSVNSSGVNGSIDRGGWIMI